jgi:hypothetical protein
MQVTLDIPEDLASEIKSHGDDIPRILELGLREVKASAQPGFRGMAEVLEALAALPSPQEIIALRPSQDVQRRISELLDKNRDVGLTAEEEKEWAQYEYLEHLVRMAKAKAHLRLKSA